MRTLIRIAALLAATAATPAFAEDFRFDFTGTVLAETRPNLTVTPQPITGTLRYEAPNAGSFAMLMGNASLVTDLYGPLTFSWYSVSRSDSLFTFSGSDGDGQGFSLRASALPGGGFGYVGGRDGFALTGEPVNASGRLSGSFTGDPMGVPEPAAWAMMMGGFGLLGGALRRARRVRVTYAHP